MDIWLQIEVDCSVSCLQPSAWCTRVASHLSVHLPGRQAADKMGNEAHHKGGLKRHFALLVSAGQLPTL